MSLGAGHLIVWPIADGDNVQLDLSWLFKVSKGFFCFVLLFFLLKYLSVLAYFIIFFNLKNVSTGYQSIALLKCLDQLNIATIDMYR